MGEAWTGVALLAGEAAAGLGLALLGALLTRAWHRRRRRHRAAGLAPATEHGQQLAGQAWMAAWQAHVRLARLEDRIAALEANHGAPADHAGGDHR
jgi:hypothetical protein